MKLNCQPGDLAITIQCAVPANLGKIVTVISFEGMQEWPHFEDPIPVWFVKASSGDGTLYYQYPDGLIEKKEYGYVPDCFLKPITPPKGHWSGNEDVDNAIQESTDSPKQLASS